MSEAFLGLNPADALAGVLGAATLTMVAVGTTGLVRKRTLRARVAAFTEIAHVALDQPRASGASGLIDWLGSLLERLLPASLVERLARRVEHAGGTLGGFAPPGVLALRLVATLCGALLAALFLVGNQFGPLGIAATLIMVPLGLLCIDLILHSHASARRQSADRELPTILDMLSLSMGAGMAFEMALETILQRLRGPLAAELRRYAIAAGGLGESRDKALLSVAHRLGNAPDVLAFVEAVNAAHVLGTGLLVAVGSQATLLRQNRRRRAAASAQRAPVRMLIPMTLFMLPTLMLVVLAPVALRLMGAT